MTTSSQTSSRFKDELRILSPWAYALAALVFVAIPVLFVVFIGRDPKAPPFAVRCLLGAIAGTLLACYVILIGYINRDAGRRGMSRLWWTLLAMFVPNGLGIVLYFILRKPRTAHCPQCAAEVAPGFSFCPRCRNRLQPVCPHCQRAVDLGDKFCPYCGGALEPSAVAPAAPAAIQPPLSS
jgi:RNA polymerase subunit RPABC4/transcription elongation factor Spt4